MDTVPDDAAPVLLIEIGLLLSGSESLPRTLPLTTAAAVLPWATPTSSGVLPIALKLSAPTVGARLMVMVRVTVLLAWLAAWPSSTWREMVLEVVLPVVFWNCTERRAV